MSGRNTNKTAKHQTKRTRIEYHGNIEHRLNQMKEFPTYPYLALYKYALFIFFRSDMQFMSNYTSAAAFRQPNGETIRS